MFAYEVDEEITLRLLASHDALPLFQLTDRSRNYLREWLPWIDGTRTVFDSEKFIQSTWRSFEEKSGLSVGIFYRGTLCGMCGYNGIDWANRIGFIGYWLGQDFQGNGIMSRAVRGLTDYGIYQLGLNRIEIRAAVENKKSRAVAERLGFTPEGIIRQGEWLYDHYVDHVVYGLLAREWQ